MFIAEPFESLESACWGSSTSKMLAEMLVATCFNPGKGHIRYRLPLVDNYPSRRQPAPAIALLVDALRHRG
jgi:hypothetical protein